MADKRIKDLTNTAAESDIASGSYFALDGSAGTKKLNSTTLLTKTAQNALAGNVAPAFDPTRTSNHPYKAGESVVYGGETYTFKVDHYGAWSADDVKKCVISTVIENVNEKFDSLSVVDSVGNIDLDNMWESGYLASGVPTASQYAWRTKNFYDCTDIDFSDNGAVVHIANADYKFVVAVYDSNGVYQTTTKTAGLTSDLNLSLYGQNRKYKIYIVRVDGTKITSLSDDAANAICYIEKTGVEVPASVGGADELLDIVDEKIAIAGGSGVVEPFTISKIAFIGDSFTMLDVYTKKVVELFGLTNSDYRNYGISGYGVMDFVEQNKKSWIGGMSDCQVATFWLGTNDFAQERPLGDLDSDVDTDFTGCLRELLSWWCGTYSFDNQLKLVITPCQRWGYNSDPIPNPTMTNGLGLTLKDYSDRIKDVAHDYGIAVLDFYEESGINPKNTARTTRDGLHPTDTYFNRLGIRIAKAIKNKCV